ncbi:MAG: YqeG family HAD IIIA-type phosphatase [Clostridia bacterium]|nr:YqeG family HAD IIIA-type phosphatase [Clostridia bacterium]
MSSKFVPDYTAERVLDIDFRRLASEGVKCVIFDADNTLLSYDETLPGEDIVSLCNELKSMGLYVCILSNGHSKRIKEIAKHLELDFIGDALKPKKKGFRQCTRQCGCTMNEAVVVGDQIFTDIWGARRAGCVSVLVTPIKLGNEPSFVKTKRVLEKLFRKSIRKNASVMRREEQNG